MHWKEFKKQQSRGEKYIDYNDGLKNLNLESLQKRRENLCLRFARNCLKNVKVKGIFSKNESNHKMIKRKKQTVK